MQTKIEINLSNLGSVKVVADEMSTYNSIISCRFDNTSQRILF